MKNLLLKILKSLGWKPEVVEKRVVEIREVPVIQEKVVEKIIEVPVENVSVVREEVIREVEVIREKVVEKPVEKIIEVVRVVPPPKTEEEIKAEYWNSRWKKADIAYYGRVLKNDTNRAVGFWSYFQLAVDVKTFISNNDSVMKFLVKKYELKGANHDDTMYRIQKFVCTGRMQDFYAGGDFKVYEVSEVLAGFRMRPEKVLTYSFDDEKYDAPDYWLFPFETAAAGFGDCEDGAILIAALAINAGIPSYRVKVACGYVTDGKVEGGHAYCIYLASDDEWRIFDWCYWPDSTTPTLKKPLARTGGTGGYYKDVWFTFNDEYAWSQKSLAITGRFDDVDDIEEMILLD